MEQRSLEWYRARLGNITGSQVGRLMKKGKTSIFSDDAMSYIYQLAAERSMDKDTIYKDDAFEEYLQQVSVETKAMRFGVEKEAEARDSYCFLNNTDAGETGLCKHKTIPHFASSPDGLSYTMDGLVALEIKCPTQATFMKYAHLIHDAADLLMVEPKYFYQCMAHMMCTGAVRTDFIAYCPFQEKKLHIVPIHADDLIFRNMEIRITEANTLIDGIITSEHPSRT